MAEDLVAFAQQNVPENIDLCAKFCPKATTMGVRWAIACSLKDMCGGPKVAENLVPNVGDELDPSLRYLSQTCGVNPTEFVDTGEAFFDLHDMHTINDVLADGVSPISREISNEELRRYQTPLELLKDQEGK